MAGRWQSTKSYVRAQRRNELLKTALEDIQRMDSEGRMGWHAKKILEKIEGRSE